VHLVGFIIKNISRCSVLWMPNAWFEFLYPCLWNSSLLRTMLCWLVIFNDVSEEITAAFFRVDKTDIFSDDRGGRLQYLKVTFFAHTHTHTPISSLEVYQLFRLILTICEEAVPSTRGPKWVLFISCRTWRAKLHFCKNVCTNSTEIGVQKAWNFPRKKNPHAAYQIKITVQLLV
jgi:hypothetical protein